MQRPERARAPLGAQLPTGVADQDLPARRPHRLQAEVVVHAAVDEGHARGERRRVDLLIPTPRQDAFPKPQARGSQDRWEGRRGGNHRGQVGVRSGTGTDPPVALFGLGETPQVTGLQVRGVEDEVGSPRQGGERAAGEQPPVAAGQPLVDRDPGDEEPEQDRGDVDRPGGEASQRREHQLVEVLRDSPVAELQLLPTDGEHGGRDRPARDARHAVETRQVPGLVQPAQRSGVEQHRPKAPTGEAQPEAELEAWFAPARGTADRRHARAVVSGVGVAGDGCDDWNLAREHGRDQARGAEHRARSSRRGRPRGYPRRHP